MQREGHLRLNLPLNACVEFAESLSKYSRNATRQDNNLYRTPRSSAKFMTRRERR